MRKLFVLATIGLLTAAVGCSVRYSRTLDNVAAADARRISATSTGLEILGIEVQDTETAANLSKQLTRQCKSLKNVEVDYRSTIILLVGIPKLTVSGDCQ